MNAPKAPSGRSTISLSLGASGRLAPLPKAYLEGRHHNLLAPLEFFVSGVGSLRSRPGADRPALSKALAVENEAWGHPRAGELAAKLADPETLVIATGQQVGLFGGPLYSLNKAIAAARWADEAESQGRSAVAVFWMATEDHDYREATTITLPASEGLRHLAAAEDSAPLTPMGDRTIGEGLSETLAVLREECRGDRQSELLEVLCKHYESGAGYGEAFARTMIHMLGERCPLMLDSQLPEMKRQQGPWLSELLSKRDEVATNLAAAAGRVRSAGYEPQVVPQPQASPLFVIEKGCRRRIEWMDTSETEDGISCGDRYRLRGGDETGGPVADLLARTQENPESVSPGVLARPALQDAILGTALQVMGPGEVSYLAQAAAVYELLGLDAPATSLRPQVSVMDEKQYGRLEDLLSSGLTLDLLLGQQQELDRALAVGDSDRAEVPEVPDEAASLSAQVMALREEAQARLTELGARTTALDASLGKPLKKTHDLLGSALEKFSQRIAAAEARADEVRFGRVEAVRGQLLPGGKLQERGINCCWFWTRYGEDLAESIWQQMLLDPSLLQVVAVQPKETWKKDSP